MPLTLEVVGQKVAQMGSTVRKVFLAGGTIGRLRDNDWVFPDEYISGHHAKIIFTNGVFQIEDTSTNGVFINSPQNRMTRGQPYVLRNGDTVYIDDYEVRVSLSSESSAEAGYSPLAGIVSSGSRAPLIPEGALFEDAAEPLGSQSDVDPLSLLGIQDARPPPPGPSAASLASNSPLSEHYRPPASAAPPPTPPPPPPVPSRPAPANSSLIPDDYDPFAADDGPLPAQTPPRAAPATPPRQTVRPPAPQPPPSAPPVAAPTMVTSPIVAPAPPARSVAPESPRVSAPPRPAANPSRDIGVSRGPAAAANAGLAPGAGAAPRPRPAAPNPPPSASPRPAAQSTASTGERRALGNVGGDLNFASLLAAAGIESERITPELSEQFGQILRVVVAGLMDVLRARERIKDEFRMRMTTFKQADNNPLKFSANVEDALHNLLVKRNAAYLGPVEAFEDAFQDLRNHQMAMLAGMRVAYDAMLAQFEPGHLQEEFDRQLKSGSFFSGPSKLKYWELYRNRFHDMVKDADSSFRDLFGDEFAKAYEEQLVRLKTLARADRR